MQIWQIIRCQYKMLECHCDNALMITLKCALQTIQCMWQHLNIWMQQWQMRWQQQWHQPVGDHDGIITNNEGEGRSLSWNYASLHDYYSGPALCLQNVAFFVAIHFPPSEENAEEAFYSVWHIRPNNVNPYNGPRRMQAIFGQWDACKLS